MLFPSASLKAYFCGKHTISLPESSKLVALSPIMWDNEMPEHYDILKKSWFTGL